MFVIIARAWHDWVGVDITSWKFSLMMQQQQVTLVATQLSRFYHKYCAVNNLNLCLERGQVLGLLGANGAGKSTTLQMLSGNLAPTTGSIQINGIDLLDQPRLAKHQLGYLPEQPALYKDLTINEQLIYAARLQELTKQEANEAVAYARQRCHLDEMQDRLIGNLSKGFRQRVGIAQAILHSPTLIILDEPTVGLDPIQVNDLRKLIRELGESHSVILSTHILSEVKAVCDRVHILDCGETVFSGDISGETVQSLEKQFFDLVGPEAQLADQDVAV
ncbi:ABC transporter ATP-binding protein [Thiolinea disciformis]|uniref:ABC transporter ATP-binding protein n=1 Tax=Thiolinea disciformis TaxID=125614 RepID=UPI001FE01001|nr:ABC transporter ATP-binding protein [Thiolinea disciformis]